MSIIFKAKIKCDQNGCENCCKIKIETIMRNGEIRSKILSETLPDDWKYKKGIFSPDKFLCAEHSRPEEQENYE
jgi:hypothetical protein